MEFSFRESNTDKVKTVVVVMETNAELMTMLPAKLVQEFFEYGFRVYYQSIGRKKSADAMVAEMVKHKITVDYDAGVEVATVDETAAKVKKLSAEDKAKVQDFLKTIGK